MKRYIPLFIIAVAISAIIGVSQYAERAKDAAEDRAKEAKAAAVAKCYAGKSADDAKYAYRPPIWARYFTWPDGVGAWAVMLTLLAIVWQSIETRAAAKAGEIAALATQNSVQVMIDSERPWIVAHMNQSKNPCLLDNGNVRFEWTVKNVGKSPAKLIKAGAMVSLDTLGPPTDKIQYSMESLDGRILVPGDSYPLVAFWLITEDGRPRYHLGKAVEDFSDFAIVYGYVQYRSAVGDPNATPYVTRFVECSGITQGVCDGFSHHWPVNPEDIRCT